MTHMQTNHTDDGDWFCHECDYQTNSYTHLKNHIERTGHASHIIKPIMLSFNCKTCDESHSSKTSLNKHIQMAHTKHKPCQKFQLNKCEWDGDCIYKHVLLKENEVACFTCGQTYVSKTTLMRHIKGEHGNVVCRKFEKNQCRFNSTSCLFNHPKEDTINKCNEKQRDVRNNTDQVFQNAPVNHVPPDGKMPNIATMLPMILTKIMPMIVNNIMTQILQQ